MKKSLVEKAVICGSSLLSLLMMFFIKVTATNTLVLGETTTTRNAGKSAIFTFLNDAKEADMFVFARVMIWIGLILMMICIAYFAFLLVLELIHKEKIIKKLSLVSTVMKFILVVSVMLILLAGLDKNQIVIKDLAKETLNITLFGFPWMLSLLFSIIPLSIKHLIKE